jgi:hypothetical protein
MAGSYCATQTVAGCLGPQACVSVIVNPKPVIGSAVGTNPSTCGGSDGFITVSGLVATQSYNVSYLKDGIPQGPIPIVANGSGQVIISGLSAGAYTNIIVTLGSCSSNAFAGPVNITTPPTPPAPVVSSNTPVCEGDALNLFANGQGGATYSWTGPSGYTSGVQNPVRNLLPQQCQEITVQHKQF